MYNRDHIFTQRRNSYSKHIFPRNRSSNTSNYYNEQHNDINYGYGDNHKNNLIMDDQYKEHIVSNIHHIDQSGHLYNDQNQPRSNSIEHVDNTFNVNQNDVIDKDSTIDDNDILNELSISELMLNDSRISPNTNGSKDPQTVISNTQPTSCQKWWASILLGIVFMLISSPIAYYASSKVTTSLGGLPLVELNPKNYTTNGELKSADMFSQYSTPNIVGLLVHTIIFILIVRLILW